VDCTIGRLARPIQDSTRALQTLQRLLKTR